MHSALKTEVDKTKKPFNWNWNSTVVDFVYKSTLKKQALETNYCYKVHIA